MTMTMEPAVKAVGTDPSVFTSRVNELIPQVERRFKRLGRPYVVATLFFLLLITGECVYLLSHLLSLTQSALMGTALASLFFSLFAYFSLRLYYRGRRPEQLLELRYAYLAQCKEYLGYQEGMSEHHEALASAAAKLAHFLKDKEYAFYSLPKWLAVLAPSLEHFSCWWHWEEVHGMRELLLQYAVEEHLNLVRLEPTSLQVHANLANAYVMLSSLYSDPRKGEDQGEDRWIPQERFSEEMEERFRETARRAMEEFRILNDYAPNDPWIHAQLAYSYRDLQMPEEEIKEYETILELQPNDPEVLFKLGALYFQRGHNAKGLQAYQRLKQSHYKKAESLIKFYGGSPSFFQGILI